MPETVPETPAPAAQTATRSLHRLTEPYILFPFFTVLLLAAIWGLTLKLSSVERDSTERTAMVATRELLETYEAQVVRALREIDQTLKFVKYAHEGTGSAVSLAEFKQRELLLPDLLFTVAVADALGNIVASTRPFGLPSVAAESFFDANRRGESLAVSRPSRVSDGEWRLHFSRPLDGPEGEFAGAVIVSVDAKYFVSGYEPTKLGEHGVLGVLGTDGVFRVRQIGSVVSVGDAVRYASVITGNEDADAAGAASVNAWDNVRRYTGARQLYDFPLAVVVGLSRDEQLAVAARRSRIYLWGAAAASLVLVVVMTALGRLNWQLAQARRREAEARMAHAQRVEYLAFHDGLTGLPNRSLFSRLLSQGIAQARRHRHLLGVLFLDLDRFKLINDTLGHDAGDDLLQETAKRLKSSLRESDTVARLGGDEFVVLVPELESETYMATVAQKILAAVARPFELAGREYRITVSVGIGIYPRDGQDEQTLTKNADIAMYHAKAEGKNNFQFFSEQLNANTLERMALETSLRLALERNEFELHYQAKTDLRSGSVTGIEALLRWRHPDLGVILPSKFIPLAEETGLIVPIGNWVLRTACTQNVAFQRQGLPAVTMAVNLSARQFGDENLEKNILAALEESGMEPHDLELEVTESMLMQDVEKTKKILAGLRALNIRVAMDDFGTGYSSLSTLKRFPLDTIKIDGSFIQDVTNNAEDKSLTQAIITMGHALSLNVVAEGVESQEQAEFLRKNACDEFQGFFFNKPMPAKEFAAVLQGHVETTAGSA